MNHGDELAMSSERPPGPPAASFQFPAGYHDIHPDVSLNYQMNRFSTGRADMVARMRRVAPRITTYRDYVEEFLKLSQEAIADGDELDGAYFLRSAEFFMFPDDPRKAASRLEFVRLMQRLFGVPDDALDRIRYGSVYLPAYRFAARDPIGSIVIFGGFDSYMEELFPILLFFRDAGFEIVGFEGPGQGRVLEDEGVPMSPAWHEPVGAVLDHFGLNDVTLIGYSLGGCLAVRAAAHEPRVRRVILDDIYTSLFEVSLRQAPVPARLMLTALLDLRARQLVNQLIERAMRRTLAVEWGVRQGMHVLGAPDPYEYMTRTRLFRTDDISGLLGQDILVLGGEEDHYVPVHQFYDQIQWLTSARSLTARLFTRKEHAQNHVHVGNVGLSLHVMIDWIIERQRNAESTA